MSPLMSSRSAAIEGRRQGSYRRGAPNFGSLAAIVPLGILSTGAGYVTFTTLVGRAGATRGAVPIYLVPVVAIALGIAFRNGHPSAIALLGAALVTVSAVLVGRSAS